MYERFRITQRIQHFRSRTTIVTQRFVYGLCNTCHTYFVLDIHGKKRYEIEILHNITKCLIQLRKCFSDFSTRKRCDLISASFILPGSDISSLLLDSPLQQHHQTSYYYKIATHLHNYQNLGYFQHHKILI